MDPKFPVFLKERDGWMILIKSITDLERIEKIDVEDNEYLGWDIEGKRIKLKIQNDEILCFISDEGYFENELREAIIYYANFSCRKGVLFENKKEIDVLKLFLEAEKYRRKKGMIKKGVYALLSLFKN